METLWLKGFLDLNGKSYQGQLEKQAGVLRIRVKLNSKSKAKSAIAAMHGKHSVFDIGHCTVIHCDAGG